MSASGKGRVGVGVSGIALSLGLLLRMHYHMYVVFVCCIVPRRRKTQPEFDNGGTPLRVRVTTTLEASLYNWVTRNHLEFGALLASAINARRFEMRHKLTPERELLRRWIAEMNHSHRPIDDAMLTAKKAELGIT